MIQDANLFGCDEPAQMRTAGCGVGAVNGDGALDPVVVGREPEIVPDIDITLTEVGDLPSDLRLEGHAEACEGAAMGLIEFGDAADGARLNPMVDRCGWVSSPRSRPGQARAGSGSA